MSPTERLNEALRGRSPLEIWGIAILGLLLALYGYLLLADHVQARKLLVVQNRALLASIEDSDALSRWAERAQAAAQARAGWDASDWRADTPGVAAAEIQAYLGELGRALRIDSPQIRVTADLIEVEGGQLLRFEMNGNMRNRQALDLIAALAESERRLIPEDISLSFRDENMVLVRMAGLAPYRGPATAQSGGGV